MAHHHAATRIFMEPTTKTETLDIEGMTCASCASAVEKSLSRAPGVQSAMVNFATEKATVHYLPGQASPASLKQAVVNAGYGVMERAPDTSAAERSAEIDRQKALAYQKLRRRFWVATVLAIIIMPLSMLMLWPALMARVNMSLLNYVLLVLTLPVLAYSGREFYVSAWNGFMHRAANMDTLIAVGTGAAFLYSLAATVVPGFFTSRGLMPEVYYDTTATIIALILLGKVLEMRAKTQTSAAMRSLIGLQAKTAQRCGSRCPHRAGAARRHRGGAPRRKGGHRRPHYGRAVVAGRSHAHRRKPARGQESRRPGIRGHAQQNRLLPL